MRFQAIIVCFAFCVCLVSCAKPQEDKADTILFNGNIYTVDEAQPTAQAIAIRGDRILLVGSNEAVKALAHDKTEMIDLQGQFAMPGFIEGHGHFGGLGSSLINLNFLQSKNWEEIVAAVAERAKTAKPGEWIIGRGWHQEKWDHTPQRQVLGYPYHDELSAASPNNPVMLSHASGHSLFANAKAMELAGISPETPNPVGGEIVRDSRKQAIGVFEERAMQPIYEAYQAYLNTLSPEAKKQQWRKGIELAQQECLKKGITSFQDAGSDFEVIENYKAMAEKGELDLRLWVMVRHSYEEMKDNLSGFPVINAGKHFFTSRAIKTELDGALGSYGAWLLAPYNDKKDFVGQNTTPIEEVQNIAKLAIDHGMQMCVHAIGDRANRETLNVCEQTFAQHPDKKDLRWRIEHAQHLDPADIPRFKQLGVIAAMQGIHCTSDAPFVVKRLGEERSRTGAYPWRSLLDAGAVVNNGTDAPVEDVDPLPSFYASVTRRRADTGLIFFPEQKMTRQEAIYSYTLANAYSAFEENDKGSLAKGKLADITVLSNDLLNCPEEEILKTKVVMTMVGGRVKYRGE
ncbi:MAG: amidohydrolase [Saprospiraceae bacterium]|nr:amidohydrolase [Saprospiraceae bacterium]